MILEMYTLVKFDFIKFLIINYFKILPQKLVPMVRNEGIGWIPPPLYPIERATRLFVSGNVNPKGKNPHLEGKVEKKWCL